MNRLTLRATALAATLALSAVAAPAATIGFMAPLSGPQALVGQDQVDGFMLALEQLGGKLEHVHRGTVQLRAVLVQEGRLAALEAAHEPLVELLEPRLGPQPPLGRK